MDYSDIIRSRSIYKESIKKGYPDDIAIVIAKNYEEPRKHIKIIQKADTGCTWDKGRFCWCVKKLHQFQASICLKCGDYIMTSLYPWEELNKSIRCKCKYPQEDPQGRIGPYE